MSEKGADSGDYRWHVEYAVGGGALVDVPKVDARTCVEKQTERIDKLEATVAETCIAIEQLTALLRRVVEQQRALVQTLHDDGS